MVTVLGTFRLVFQLFRLYCERDISWHLSAYLFVSHLMVLPAIPSSSGLFAES